MDQYLKSKKVGFIGAGNMTKALVSGLIKKHPKLGSSLVVSSRTQEKVQRLQADFGIQEAKSNDEVLENCDWIVLSMKPQDLPEFLDSYSKSFDSSQTVISLCAGVSLSSLKKQVPMVTQVARLIPSTPVAYGEGVMGLFTDDKAFEQSLLSYFDGVGKVIPVDSEDLLEGVMISAASGVGFMLEILEIWSEWLEDKGFSKEEAGEIVKASFGGVAALIKESEKTFFSMQSEVVSKKGVTLAGLESMRQSEIDSLLNRAFEAALLRNKELSGLL